MNVLVIANVSGNHVHDSLYNLFGAVKRFATKCDVLVSGYKVSNAVQAIAKYSMVGRVLSLDSVHLEHNLPENLAPAVAKIAQNYTHVLIAADSFGKNLLPRIAGMLEVNQISEVVDIVSDNVFKKFVYAGNVLVTVESLAEMKLLTVRAMSFNPETQVGHTHAQIIEFNDLVEDSGLVKFISQDLDDVGIDLEGAKVVVTGGQSLGSKENFGSLIRGLADKLGAGVGASRAAVEAGFAPNDAQIGQTGKVVAPEIYLAVGISGAVQHIAGMKDSRTVFAINNDQSAPIFDYADYGLVADLFSAVPEILEKITK